jgi:SAM-dependent methyltransferase
MRFSGNIFEFFRMPLVGMAVVGFSFAAISCGPGEPPQGGDENPSTDAVVSEPVAEGMAVDTDVVDLAPFVTTPFPLIELMLEIAEVDSSDVVYDIGSGDGRIVNLAAQEFGARSVGIEIDPELIATSREIAEKIGVSHRVEFRLGDATKMDLSEATVVTAYLVPESLEILRPQFEKQLRPGTYVISHNYAIPGWEDKEIAYKEWAGVAGVGHTIWAYRR